MKKGINKKILILPLFILTLLTINLVMVSAVNPFDTFFAKGGTSIFSDWGGGNTNVYLAKILLTVLIALVVFSIGSQIPGIKTIFTGDKEILGYIFSLIVGFLSMAYITPEEVYAIVTTYSALGFALGVGIPFIVLLFFTITLATEGGDAAAGMIFRKIIAYGLWGAFIGFLIYRIVLSSGTASISQAYNTLTWIILLLSIVIILALGVIWKKVQKAATKEEINLANRKIDKTIEGAGMLARVVEGLSSNKKNN